MLRKVFVLFGLIVSLSLFFSYPKNIHSQEDLDNLPLNDLDDSKSSEGDFPDIPYSAYEIMEKVTKELSYPFGLTKIQFTVTNKSGSVTSYKVSLYHQDRNSLLLFDSISKGRLLKLLINDNGKNIYLYDQITKTLYHKRSKDKFERVLYSGMSYFDFANVPFLNNYTPRIAGFDNVGGKRYLKVENIPLDRGEYSRLDVFVDPEKNYRVSRIDYYDRYGTLWKNLTVLYKDLPVRKKNKIILNKQVAAQLEMADLSSGTITYFEMLLNDKNIRIDDSLFDRQNIEK